VTDAAYSNAIKGALWMLGASICYVSSATLTRYLAGSYPTFELTFLRCLVGVIVLTPLVLRGDLSQLKTTAFPLHCVRAVLTYISILLWFYATEKIPVGDFFAIQFVSPLFTIAVAAVLLREKVSAKSWLAALIGFLGVMVIIRPGYIPVSLGVIAALGTAAAYAFVNTCIKVLSRQDSPMVMTFYVNVLVLVLAVIPAYLTWKTPIAADWPILIAVALFATLAQFCVASSISLADARVVQPMNFLRMPIAAAMGFMVFGEFPDLWTWFGAVIIFGAAWYAIQQGKKK
jgi:drug/metabolite transporter (DMT)-like permease